MHRPTLPISLITISIVCVVACATSSEKDPPEPLAQGGALAVWPEVALETDGTATPKVDPTSPWYALGKDDLCTQPPENTTSGTGGGVASGGSGSGGIGGQGSAPDKLPPEPTPEPADLLLRGYYESTSSQKLLLVEHLGGGPTASCRIEVYSNGGTEPWRTFPLPDGLAAGNRHLLCIPDAFHPACDATFSGSAFNGNDAVRIVCAQATQDILGLIGVDPGDSWEGAGTSGEPISTLNQGLWRCRALSSGPGPSFVLSDWVAWSPSADPDLAGALCPPDDAQGMGGASAFQ